MSELEDKTNEDNERTIDEDEEPEDLVDLMKEMEANFHKGVTNSDTNYQSPSEYLQKYNEHN